MSELPKCDCGRRLRSQKSGRVCERCSCVSCFKCCKRRKSGKVICEGCVSNADEK
jgi:hypothetical protein